MRHTSTYLILLASLAVAGALAIQHQSTTRLTSDLAALREELAQAKTAYPSADEAPALPSGLVNSSSQTQVRLAALEQAVAQLSSASESLRGRGPLTPSQLNVLVSKVADPTATDTDRLQALRLLRRQNGLTDATVSHALAWLQSATNASVREDILGQLAGVTNAALREPLLALAASDANADVREEAVEKLSRFANDPAVEEQLWRIIQQDPARDVRQQAMEALIEGPISEARLATLRQRATHPDSSFDERLVSWRALREAGQDVPEASATLAQLAQTTQDPLERARLFQTLDDGINSPKESDSIFLPPLIQGLQDDNPVVRERAADALRDFDSNPTVQQWLRYAAQNDADPAVRRQALRAVGNRRN